MESSTTKEPSSPHEHHPPAETQPPVILASGNNGQAGIQRKRKKGEGSAEDGGGSSEPRRLRRSHEACSRCRGKKIKCDSKHPRCTACATANTQCTQEDRIRQTLTPRGHTDHLEHLLTQCNALLKSYDPGFDLANIEDILARRGIDPNNTVSSPSVSFEQARSPTFRAETASPSGRHKIFSYPPIVHPGFPLPLPYGHPPPPPGAVPYPIPHGFPPHLHAPFQPIPPSAPPPSNPADTTSVTPSNPFPAVLGQDPRFNDMSSDEALCKNFGVSEAIVNDVRVGDGGSDKEDLAVGSSGLTSGRDRVIGQTPAPKDHLKWFCVTLRRNSNPTTLIALGPIPTEEEVQVWLPKDRLMLDQTINIYFRRLNIHRPVFPKDEFDRVVDDLYEGQTVPYDPGFLCSLYLILALGTLSDLSHRVSNSDSNLHTEPTVSQTLRPSDWPEHREFFSRALAVKPDLRVTISSLQALILLHWYLYTERQTRTLWRLVGSLVRLGIELGLHHDPFAQQNTFTKDECKLRVQLWATLMIHDRGTSILLGRPLAINLGDSNTPHPRRLGPTDPYASSEHFLFSHPIADIQADIIKSLYAPHVQTGDEIIGHADRILRHMSSYRKQLPSSYSYYFAGTQDWSHDRKARLVQDLTEDQGLTLLKLWITRILLFRAIFNSKDLPFHHRFKALRDAIVTCHNVIVIHQQLIKFPDIGFFTSPSPLHIAAMIILYGYMSKNDCLTKETVLEDIWIALDMLPSIRWPWERQDGGGGYPLIARLTERVMEVDLNTLRPPTNVLVLLPEIDWGTEELASSPIRRTTVKSQQSTPTLPSAGYPTPTSASSLYPSSQPSTSSPHAVHHPTGPLSNQQLVELPDALLYPFYPEDPVNLSVPEKTGPTSAGSEGSTSSLREKQSYSFLLATAASSAHIYGYPPPQDMFMSEDGVQTLYPQHHQPRGHSWSVNEAITIKPPLHSTHVNRPT